MKGLIAERPNLKPHGIGNSQGGFNPAVLASGAGTPDDDDEDDEAKDNRAESPARFHDGDEDDEHAPHARWPLAGRRASVGADGEEEPEPAPPPAPTRKHARSPSLSSDELEDIATPATPAKAPSKGKKGRSTPARPNTSKPAGNNEKHDKKRSKTGGASDRFTNAVTEENETQRELIKTRRANADTAAELSKAKINASTRLKERALELKSERLLQRDRMDHERRMAEVHAFSRPAASYAPVDYGMRPDHSYPPAHVHGGYPVRREGASLALQPGVELTSLWSEPRAAARPVRPPVEPQEQSRWGAVDPPLGASIYATCS
jgi:hypothetical protein